jgi:hypothetical protein
MTVSTFAKRGRCNVPSSRGKNNEKFRGLIGFYILTYRKIMFFSFLESSAPAARDFAGRKFFVAARQS